MQATLNRDHVLRCLTDALVRASADLMPRSSAAGAEEFHPMDHIRSTEDLLRTLDFVDRTYRHRIPAAPLEKPGVMLLLESIPMGHPVFLIGTLYVLLMAGGDIHARFDREYSHLSIQILAALADSGVIREFIPSNRYSHEELVKYFHKRGLSRLVCLGDSPNAHSLYPMVRRLGDIRFHYPSSHLLIADYRETPEFTDKQKRFADMCWQEDIDYEGYRAPTNDADELYLGFDFGDLFWGADAVVNSWNSLAAMGDRLPALIFTDRPREQVWLPEGIHNCFRVVFFEDYGCDVPLYDFSQLVM